MSARWLYPSQREGIEIEDAREWRLKASAGRVTELGSASNRRSVATPGDVTRAAIVTGADVPRRWQLSARLMGPSDLDQVLVLTSDDDLLLAVRLLDVAYRGTTGGESLRRTSGVGAFVGELGLPLEAATPRDVSLLRRARTPTGSGRRLTRQLAWSQAGLYVVGAVGIMVLALTQGSVSPPYALAAIVQAITGIGLLSVLIVSFRRFRAVTSPPEPEGRSIVAATADPRSSARGELQLGRTDLVWSAAGREEWVPGVDRAGADTCAIGRQVLSFRRGETALLEVPAGGLDQDSLTEAAHVAGLRVIHAEPASNLIAREAALHASSDPLRQLSTLTRGAPFASLGIFIMSGFLLVTTVLNPDPGVDRLSAFNVAGGVVAVGIFVTMAAVELRRRAWSRRVRAGRPR